MDKIRKFNRFNFQETKNYKSKEINLKKFKQIYFSLLKEEIN